MSFLHQFGLTFMAFFAIMNPVASLPVYLSLTADKSPAVAQAIGHKALLIAFGIVAVFSLSGQYIFEMFGITLPALRLAGGALVFLIGVNMLQGNHKPQHHQDAEQMAAAPEDTDVAITPLGTPLLAGPGTIATAMSLSAHHSLSDMLATILSFALLCVTTGVLFRYSKTIIRLIGNNAMTIMTRMMGLILAVIGAQMLIAGALGAFPNWQ